MRATHRLRTRRSGCIVAYALSSTPTAQQRTRSLPPAALSPPSVSPLDRLSLPRLDPSTPPQPVTQSPPSFGTRTVTRCPSVSSSPSPSPALFVFRRRSNLERTAENRAESLSVAGRTPQHSAVAVPSNLLPPKHFSQNASKSLWPSAVEDLHGSTVTSPRARPATQSVDRSSLDHRKYDLLTIKFYMHVRNCLYLVSMYVYKICNSSYDRVPTTIIIAMTSLCAWTPVIF